MKRECGVKIFLRGNIIVRIRTTSRRRYHGRRLQSILGRMGVRISLGMRHVRRSGVRFIISGFEAALEGFCLCLSGLFYFILFFFWCGFGLSLLLVLFFSSLVNLIL